MAWPPSDLPVDFVNSIPNFDTAPAWQNAVGHAINDLKAYLVDRAAEANVITIVGAPSGGLITWTNMPSALTEFNAGTGARAKVNLAKYTQARITARVAVIGSTNAELRIQYSTDESTWAYLDGASGPGVNIFTTGTKASAYVALTTLAKADVFLRVVGINGDGAADPQIGLVTLQLLA